MNLKIFQTMTMQEWKAKINGFFQPKSQAERQKMMKYLVVFPAAVVCGIVILWLLYTSLNKNDSKVGNAFNTEIPEGENDGIKTKAEEYAAADAAKEKEAQQRAVVALDTLTALTTDTVEHQSAVENSAQAYQEVQASLNDFFVEDTSADNVEMEALNERIAELEAQNALAQRQTAQPDEMELMERSYQLAAQYMGNGGNYSPPQPTEEKGKRDVQPVAQVNRNVVSTLGQTSTVRGFNTSVGTMRAVAKNTIAAVVAGNQSVVDGESVKLRTVEPMWVGNRLIPRNTTIVGSARVQGERLEIEITSIECEGSIYEVELQVYDSDGQEGINIPQSMESDALHEIGANMGSTMGSSINISTNTGAQIASDVGRGLINGVSQYLTKKLRTVKVHLKAGYRVMLHQPEDI
ncbi:MULTISPECIES: conjugative transposon protein TraM [Bacteroidales]|jgi:conjugative transposon TraM protein|uniref:conjugative transposon protein TraM n=1 Tax=Bacteroidales TaxID=171549 RepID=UPI000F49F8DE|nr:MULTISPECIES: conjugative transposon protein TraM [Bacteroidales]MCI9030831.1 conjugative transposon protein TraM [Muribaculaceae bacterium]ROT05171.1 conjugative transposon protein TraM [Muribaculaceae bacterium Isolate-104 (HZI)]